MEKIAQKMPAKAAWLFIWCVGDKKHVTYSDTTDFTHFHNVILGMILLEKADSSYFSFKGLNMLSHKKDGKEQR